MDVTAAVAAAAKNDNGGMNGTFFVNSVRHIMIE